MAALDFGSEPVTGEAFTLDNAGTPIAAFFARPEHLPNAGLVIATDIGGMPALCATSAICWRTIGSQDVSAGAPAVRSRQIAIAFCALPSSACSRPR